MRLDGWMAAHSWPFACVAATLHIAVHPSTALAPNVVGSRPTLSAVKPHAVAAPCPPSQLPQLQLPPAGRHHEHQGAAAGAPGGANGPSARVGVFSQTLC